MVKIDNAIQKKLFSIFSAKGMSACLSPAMKTPFEQDNYICAGDQLSMIQLSKDIVTMPLKKNSKMGAIPIFQSAIPEPINHAVITKSEIRAALNRADINHRHLFTKCQECRGSKYVVWTYTTKNGEEIPKEDQCPVCFGEGKLPNGELKWIPLGDKMYDGHQLLKLYHTMDLLELDGVTAYYDNDAYAFFPLTPGVDLLIMAALPYPPKQLTQ